MFETFKGEIFCPSCGSNMALGIDTKLEEPAVGKEYIKRTLYLFCSNQNCPEQSKRKGLPKI